MTATIQQVVGMLKGFLAGDEVARLALADACEEVDGETANILRGSTPQWLGFDTGNAKGDVGIGRGTYGPTIHLPSCEDPAQPHGDGVGYVDLWLESPDADGEGDPSFPTGLVFFDARFDEAAVRLLYRPGGALDVVIHRDMTYAVLRHSHGIHSTGDHVLRFPTPEAPETTPAVTGGLSEFAWTHVFPDQKSRTVTLYVREGVNSLRDAVVAARYANHRFVHDPAFDSLLAAVAQTLADNGFVDGGVGAVASSMFLLGYAKN